ncbi:bifunctional aminoglycoside phosphotransferase/ATP-binding protein [Nitrosovibrio sp. Nv6]|uniref:bifunctional aminoglycoside phosphotransferase/ATP-binding protein n=1 Tax=Nitrosovibrio sp. Nv6 TaxID=1855340 RepID=UPI002101B112|nr:bifunctional aminoglycoside phosphotransferase/ATP-binding protein [Nitrosovibrio sp. Nv6]
MPPKQSQPLPHTPRAEGDIQNRLIKALMDCSRYPHAARSVRLAETHISCVLLAGRYAYKIKKPVDLGFLNFTSLASRRYYCDEEIRLNRRLAPKIYLDVIPIGGTPERPEFGALPAIEYAIRMRRFPASGQFDRLAAHNKILPEHIDSLAFKIADFHNALPVTEAASAFGSPDVIYSAVAQTLDRLQAALKGSKDEGSVAALRHASEKEYAGCKKHFVHRHAQGFIRECHGDLHLGNIALIDGQPVPFDGIEFDPALRWIDVMSEVAFTVMDLLHYKRADLAYRFLNGYLEVTGDYDGVSVLRFYIVYRAAVRAMVNAIRARQTSLSKRVKAEGLARCRSFLALAVERVGYYQPGLVITHGLPGSGKTTFAQAALEQLQAIRIRSDVERKRLFGLAPLADSSTHASSIYSADATRRTYARLLELAKGLLTAGMPVIVDAAFLNQNEREHFRQLAHELAAPFAIASMKSSTATLRSRIMQRQSQSNDASEADLAVLELLQEKQEALSAQERAVTVEFVNEEAGITADEPAWKKLKQLLGTT